MPMLDYDIRRGRTYQYAATEPLYAFGHGLSYTRFVYSGLTTSATELEAGGTLRVSFELTNAGELRGDEVVQLYPPELRRTPAPRASSSWFSAALTARR